MCDIYTSLFKFQDNFMWGIKQKTMVVLYGSTQNVGILEMYTGNFQDKTKMQY